MNWNEIGNAISKYAPLAGAALTSPVGAVIGVGTVIANLFGVEADPESVMDYIHKNPEKAEERLKNEMANNIELQKISLEILKERNRSSEQNMYIEAQDRDSARKNTVNINESPVDNNIKMRLVNSQIIVLFVCVSAIIGALFYSKPIDAGLLAMLGMVVGSVLKSVSEKDGFYWGTSVDDNKK